MGTGEHLHRSFEPDASRTTVDARGQVAHEVHIAHSTVLERRFYEVRLGVWCLVGNGLSNQTFIDAPDGIIAIDTGESTQEMAAALAELRAVTDRPIVAVLYTHFHYVSGTAAIVAEAPEHTLPIYGHERIAFNLRRAGAEIGPTYGRGIAEQFAVTMPADGPDGVVNVGLGFYYRNPAHAPFTPGHLPVTHPFSGACTLQVAGLTIEVQPAPSDADDSVTYWFADLGVAVNNLVWPTLFNIFAIRGEEYRDPRVMLAGLDHLLALGAEHLVATHGPPISGAASIAQRVTGYRDSIQFLWDQTVRLANRGYSSVDIAHRVRLPEQCDLDYLTREHYGVAEHHVRQIRSGLFGFFDGDPANLFPLEPVEHATRMIAGFGGRAEVRRQADAAIAIDDLRWAIELASWLVRDADDDTEAAAADRRRLAQALRLVAQRTTAANIRNWCLTRALELDGTIDNSRLSRHRFSARQLMAAPIAESIRVLRVLVDPEAAEGIGAHLAWHFTDGTAAGLHIRNCVAVPTDGAGAATTLACDPATWAAIMAGNVTLSAAIADGSVRITGHQAAAVRALACFDVEGLRA